MKKVLFSMKRAIDTCVHSVKRTLYSIKRALYSVKKTLHSMKRVLYSMKRALNLTKRDLYSIKELTCPGVHTVFLHKCQKHYQFSPMYSIKRAVYSIKIALYFVKVTCMSWCTHPLHRYGVATMSRLLKIIGLFCKRAL